MSQVPYLSPKMLKKVVTKKAKNYGAKKVTAEALHFIYRFCVRKWKCLDIANTQAKVNIIKGTVSSLYYEIEKTAEYALRVENGILITKKRSHETV